MLFKCELMILKCELMLLIPKINTKKSANIVLEIDNLIENNYEYFNAHS